MIEVLQDRLFGTYAVFYREMLLFRKKMMRLGFVFYSISTPILYLLAFGLGLGSRVSIPDYGAFLVQGISCMSSMTNSFNMVSISVSMGRLQSGAFQTVMTSPVRASSVMRGLVMSGIVRAVFSVLSIMLAGVLIFHVFPFTPAALAALVLNAAFFSCAGVIVGLVINDMEHHAVLTNFIIMPMSFFSGTFYPLDFLPVWLRNIIYILPLSHTNIIIREGGLTHKALLSWCLLILLTLVCFFAGSRMLERYGE